MGRKAFCQTSRLIFQSVALWVAAAGIVFAANEPGVDGAAIDFDRSVRPILADRCYACHGPDARARQGDLRLDSREAALADRGGAAAIVPGDVERSELIVRIFADDAQLRMPPPDAKAVLTDEEKEILRQWVQAGAPWSEHWSFRKLAAPSVPGNHGVPWGRNEIDAFVLKGLTDAGLHPGPEADKRTLVRRLYLDLQGLPPSAAEVESLVNDDAPHAYERLVDRLLASDLCAERLTLDWMDLARYADSHGLHADGARTMWPWRDWVISAFERNLPYDHFVTWQLAGDLLANPTREQRLATAFLRNHPMTAEGGVIEEEVRLNYVFDRVETTATAFLGLTIGCARCHDHKFDPLSQRDYYGMAAFFNNVRELGMTGDDGDYGPLLALPSEEALRRLRDLRRAVKDADTERSVIRQTARAEFERGQDPVSHDLAGSAGHLPPTDHEIVFPLDSAEAISHGDPPRHQLDGNEASTTAAPPKVVAGISGEAMEIAGDFGFLELKGGGLIDVAEPMSASVWIRPGPQAADQSPKKTRVLLGTAGNKNQFWRGWEFFLDEESRLAVRLVHARPDNLLHVRSTAAIADSQWTHVAFAYDGSGRAAGVTLFIGGRKAPAIIVDDRLSRSIFPAIAAPGYPRDEGRAVRAGRSYRAFGGDFGVYNGALDDIRIYSLELTALEVESLFSQASLQPAAGAPGVTAVDNARYENRFEHWLRRENSAWRHADQEFRNQLAKLVKLSSELPQVMVMSDAVERPTFALERGEYDRPRERVTCGTPASVLAWDAARPQNRLGLAQWLFDPANPLTARVAVNRYWQLIFGQGLVRTTHDFGNQGERPSHPELLDWLAINFRESGWNVRALLKQMVLSSTYRQSSSLAAWREFDLAKSPRHDDPQALDPGNRLLWRGSSYRLPAEVIRDSALAASGLLVRKVGGPSVKPYQPAGLWTEKNNFSQDLADYLPDKGEGLYRRSLYTFVRRTSPPPNMITFDATDRTTCAVKRETTNTPLQALVLLNDPQFVEAARVLAERVQHPDSRPVEECVNEIFTSLMGRAGSAQEQEMIGQLYQEAASHFARDAEAASALLSIGDRPRDARLDALRTAALTVVANTLMNFDEFYMRR